MWLAFCALIYKKSKVPWTLLLPSLLFAANRDAPFLLFFWSICRLKNSLFLEFTDWLPLQVLKLAITDVHWLVLLSVPAQETWMCAWDLVCAWRNRTSCGKGRNMLLLLWKRFLIWRKIWKSMRQAIRSLVVILLQGLGPGSQTEMWKTKIA